MSITNPALTYGQKRLVEAASKGGFTIGHAGGWNESEANCAAAGMERAIFLAEELRRAQEVIARLEEERRAVSASREET